MTWFLYTQFTSFKTIWSNFTIVYPTDFFQDHMTWVLHCVPNWLLSRPFDLISALCTQLAPFKTIWPNFIVLYPVDSFQDHYLIFVLCTQLIPFKTIWPDILHLLLVFHMESSGFHIKSIKSTNALHNEIHNVIHIEISRWNL